MSVPTPAGIVLEIATEADYRAAQQCIASLVPPVAADAVGGLLNEIDDYLCQLMCREAQGVPCEVDRAMVAAGQAAQWSRLFRLYVAGSGPFAYDDRNPGDEWHFLWGDDWPRMVPQGC